VPRPPGDTLLDAAGRLPLALAAKVLGELGSPVGLPVMPLVLMVDDFDLADARSRDFVRELARSRVAANGHGQDRPLTLVLNTEDADQTETFLGLRGAGRLERVVTGGTTKEGQRRQLEGVARPGLLRGRGNTAPPPVPLPNTL